MPSQKLEKFYWSRRWRKMSLHIKMIRGGICEECNAKGEEVHHIIPLTDNNVDDYNISLSETNLQLLCKSCHNAKRNSGLIREDLDFDEQGNVVKRKKTPPSILKKNV